MKKILSLVSVFSCLSASLSAVVTISLIEVGSNVEITIAGSINTTDLTNDQVNGFFPLPGITANSATINAGFYSFADGGAPIDRYSGLTGPTSFGSAGYISGSGGTGDQFTIGSFSLGNFILVPQGYVSGGSINATTTMFSRSLADFGLSANDSFTWTWGSGANADSVTLNAVPEPSFYATVAGLLALGLVWQQRRKQT